MLFDLAVFLTAVLSAAVASVAGFGIGSLLTPLLAVPLGTKLAVALVTVPHFLATTIRFWWLRQHVDKKVLLSFGVTSALGGLTGAFLNTYLATPALTMIFGFILIFAGFMGLTEALREVRLSGTLAFIAGAVSGFLGGLVGNQGGIRSAAMLGFHSSKVAFVATATATGVIVDLVRSPVYFYHYGYDILSHSGLLMLTCSGVVIGTLIGAAILKHIPERLFRRVVSAFILLLGISMLVFSN